MRDLIGHVAYWDARDAGAARRRAAGAPEEPADWRTLNEQQAPLIAARSLADVLDDLHRSHAAIVAEFDRLEPDDARSAALGDAIRDAACDHYEEHAAEIRAWRGRSMDS